MNKSGKVHVINPRDVRRIQFFRLRHRRHRQRSRVVGFFEFDNMTDIDLSRYQIYGDGDVNEIDFEEFTLSVWTV